MNRIVVDDALRSKLDGIRTETQLCDGQGHILGTYIPDPGRYRRWYEWAKGRYSEAELDRRANEQGEKTTAEVLKALKSP